MTPRRSGPAPPRRGRVPRHPTRQPPAPRPGPPGPTSTRSAQPPQWLPSGTSPSTSAHARHVTRHSLGLLTGWADDSPHSATRSAASPFGSPAGVSWGVPVPAGPLGERDRDPGRRAAAAGLPRRWAPTSTPCRRRRAPRTTPAASACCSSWPGRPPRPDPAAGRARRLRRRGAARPGRRRAPLRLAGLRRRARPAERPSLLGMVSLDRVGVRRRVPVCTGRGVRPRAARSCSPRPARRRPGHAASETAPATTGRSRRRGSRWRGSAARRTPATTRPATCRAPSPGRSWRGSARMVGAGSRPDPSALSVRARSGARRPHVVEDLRGRAAAGPGRARSPGPSRTAPAGAP